MPTKIIYKSFDDLELAAYSYGPNDADLTVLCLHGLTRNHKDFEPMISALASDYQFIAIDTRGRGESQYDPSSQNYLPTVYVRDVLTLLDHLALQRVVLIGTSMGGIMSMLLMPLIPERICGVVLNDIGPVVNPVGLKRIGDYVGSSKPLPDWQAAADAVRAVNAVAFPHFAEQDWLEFAQRTCRENADGTVSLDYDPRIAEAFNPVPPNQAAKLLAWRLFARMKKHPLLIVRGEQSDLLTDSVARRMQRRHPDAELIVVPDTGHAPLLNEPVVISALQQFLARLHEAETER